MDTNDMSGNAEQAQDAVPEVPERPTPSGWVVVKKARKPRAAAGPAKKAASAKKQAPRRKAAPVARKRSSGKRELIDTGRNKMFAKRGAKGRFKEMDDVGRSLSADRRRSAKTKAKSGYGDQGDGRARGKKKTAKKTARKGARKTARKGASRKAR
jgi:hypothetical protein